MSHTEMSLSNALDRAYAESDTLRRQRDALREAAIALIADMPILQCFHLHHAAKDRHSADESCPVQLRIIANKDKLLQAIKECE